MKYLRPLIPWFTGLENEVVSSETFPLSDNFFLSVVLLFLYHMEDIVAVTTKRQISRFSLSNDDLLRLFWVVTSHSDTPLSASHYRYIYFCFIHFRCFHFLRIHFLCTFIFGEFISVVFISIVFISVVFISVVFSGGFRLSWGSLSSYPPPNFISLEVQCLLQHPV